MTVARLRQLLAELPDDAPVLVEAGDHSYRLAGPVATAVVHTVPRRGTRVAFCEQGGVLEAGEELVAALVVR